MIALFSIKPEFALKLFNGNKFYEYRRAVFAQSRVNRIVVYASSPVMRIIGELEIDKILEGSPKRIWNETSDKGGVDRSRFFDYFSNRQTAYAIGVKRAMAYRFSVDPRTCLGDFRPPQSFQYLDSVALNKIRTASSGFARRNSRTCIDTALNTLAFADLQRAIA
jgi:predicted transcriptional regulator